MNKNLLTPTLINQLDNLYFKARYVVEGYIVGMHKSPFHGFSVEFSEHKPYNKGDDLRHSAESFSIILHAYSYITYSIIGGYFFLRSNIKVNN